jgi:hypothetical protein
MERRGRFLQATKRGKLNARFQPLAATTCSGVRNNMEEPPFGASAVAAGRSAARNGPCSPRSAGLIVSELTLALYDVD